MQDVQKAEKEAIEKLRAEHPEYSEEELKIKMSDAVNEDDKKRKERDPRRYMPPFPGGIIFGGRGAGQ